MRAAALLLLLFIRELLMSAQLCHSRHSSKTACLQVNSVTKIDAAYKIILQLRMIYNQEAVSLWPYLVKYASLRLRHSFFFFYVFVVLHVWVMCWGSLGCEGQRSCIALGKIRQQINWIYLFSWTWINVCVSSFSTGIVLRLLER